MPIKIAQLSINDAGTVPGTVITKANEAANSAANAAISASAAAADRTQTGLDRDAAAASAADAAASAAQAALAAGYGAIIKNDNVITGNLSLPSGFNGHSVGPVELAAGVTVDVAPGSVWAII